MQNISSISLGLAAGLVFAAATMAEPLVPGFNVEVYAEVPFAQAMTFDPSGVMYVSGNVTSGPIYRVEVGGTLVSEFGPPINEPGAVLFDAGGGISGTPGSVLVSGANFSGGVPTDTFVLAIAPDETATNILSGPFPDSSNGVTTFDRNGRVILAGAARISALTTEGEEVIDFGRVGFGGAQTVDSVGRIYSLRLDGLD